MAIIEGRTGLELLKPAACWQLLASQQVGRVGVVAGGQPEILPVNYAVDGRSVVFRTDKGLKQVAVQSGAPVAFEIDAIDSDTRTGWSVLVKGRAERVTDAATLRRLRALPLDPWAQGEKAHWIRIVPRDVSGRRIVRATTTA
jgi:nitroimidazol reductase NimA-like FMN-containing flavoprotein (pyridoxamine 5'-phosphate oxidase superfamily)